MRSLRAAACTPLIVIASLADAGPHPRPQVDANLVTALDASDSVGTEEDRIEREGLALAVTDPQFLDVVQAGHHRQIGFAVFSWSSHGATQLLVPWTLIRSPEDAAQVARRLRASRPTPEWDEERPTDHIEASREGGLTDIAQAISLGAEHLRHAPFAASRSVVNIVGRGPSNSGPEPSTARDAAPSEDYIINGVVVGVGSAGDTTYYRREVVGGPGSFVMQVSEADDMAAAFAAKLRLDIAGLWEAPPPGSHFRLTAIPAATMWPTRD